MLKISVLHPYLEERIDEIEKGLYPKHHLWGLDALTKYPDAKLNFFELIQLNFQCFLRN